MSSQDSPILSRGGEQRESREKRDGELDLMFSFAARDQEGLMPPSLKAKGLAMDDLEDKLCRWMLLTKGRTVKPPEKRTEEEDQPLTDVSLIRGKKRKKEEEEAVFHHHLHRVLLETPPTLPARPATCAWTRLPRPSWQVCCLVTC